MRYDYMEAMTADIRTWIADNDWHGGACDLEDELWNDDSVTGNASGSYTMNTELAKEYVLDNTGMLKDALTEFGCEDKAIDILCYDEWEYADVTIRCYLLPYAIDRVYREDKANED